MNISLHHETTSAPLYTVRSVSYLDAWRCLQASIASDLRVDIDDVETSEDDDGIEWVSVSGKRLGYIATEIGGVKFGEPAAALAAAE